MECRGEDEKNHEVLPRDDVKGKQENVGSKDEVELVEWKPWSAGFDFEAAFEEGFDEIASDCAESEKCGVEWDRNFFVVQEGVVGEDSPVCEV